VLGNRLTVALVACAALGSSLAHAALKSSAPKDVDLSGHWKLNASLSEDPHAAVEVARKEMDAQGKKDKNKKGGLFRRNKPPVMRGPDEGGRLPPGESVPPEGPDRQPDDAQGNGESADGPGARDYDPLEAAITTPEEFAIQQESESFVLLLKESTDTCKPKQPGTVSTPEAGLAKRACGWDRNAFVVELNPAHGPLLTTRYELDKASGRLFVTSSLKGERLPKIEVKRVYERSEPPE
jgi:hypothetical protein